MPLLFLLFLSGVSCHVQPAYCQIVELFVRIAATTRKDTAPTYSAGLPIMEHVLDGGIIIANGSIIGRFTEGHAEILAGLLIGQVSLRDSQGKPLETLVVKQA